MISGEAFWDAYNKFDFGQLESEVRSLALAETSQAEKRATGWGFFTLSAFAGEVIAGTYALTEQSPKSLGVFAATSLSLAVSFLRARYWSNEAGNTPVI